MAFDQPEEFMGPGFTGAQSRPGARPETEVVWYVLNPNGLELRRSGGIEIDEGLALQVPWSAMERLDPVNATPPWMRLVYRLAGAAVSSTLELKSQIHRRDGMLFGDRMRLWYDAKATVIEPPPFQPPPLLGN